ncbi:MAG: MCE family protein [Verrucomicrobia bacterium]|nr:MCE family protein [Verrucomicrobiota bacterium]
MNDDRPKKNAVILALFFGLGLVLLAGLFFGVEDNPFRPPALSFSIRFDDVTGVREHSKVYFLGIPVGYVTHVDYAPDAEGPAVRVDVAVTRRMPIPANVVARLEPTLLGDASIALRFPEPEQASGNKPSPTAATAGRGTLANQAKIRGERATKLEAVMPGFDQAIADLKSFVDSTGQRMSALGTVVDHVVTSMNLLFFQKGPDGKSAVESLIAVLEELINGPEGKQDESIRSQLQTIVTNLRASSENLKNLSDLQNRTQGSVGEVLRVFEETAKRLQENAIAAQKVIAKIGRTSDAVSQASEQINVLATKATQAVQDFYSRPMHFLATTRAPKEGKPTPTPRR